MNTLRQSPPPPPLTPGVHRPRYSGISLSGTALVQALVDAVDHVTREGGLNPVTQAVYVLQNLNLCKPWHWAAYAKLAHTPVPDQTTQEAVKAVYLERCKP